MKKALIIGGVIADVVINVDHVPKPGEDINADSLKMMAGGCAYNVSCVLQDFGTPYTLFAPIGKGMYASFIQSQLAERGITPFLFSDLSDSGYSISLVDKNAERTFINIQGMEMHFRKEWFNRLNMDDYDFVYIAGYEMEQDNFPIMLDFLKQCRNQKILFAPGPSSFRFSKSELRQIFELSPIVHLNHTEALYISGEDTFTAAAEYIHQQTGAPVILTIGSKGCYIQTSKSSRHIPSEDVKVIDTIGAGDAHAATIVAMLKLNYDLFEAARVANHVSSQIVAVSGPNLPANALNLNVKEEKKDA